MATTRTPKGDWFEVCSSSWGSAIRRRRYDDALMVAIAAYMLARELRDEGHQIASHAYMAAALQRLDEKSTAALKARNRKLCACSFCGRTEKEVRIALGAGGNICEECTATARSIFESEPAKRIPGRKGSVPRARKALNLRLEPSRAKKARRSSVSARRK
jgi:hypothetical protein